MWIWLLCLFLIVAFVMAWSLLVVAATGDTEERCNGIVHYPDNEELPCTDNQGHNGACHTIRDWMQQRKITQ